MVSSILISLKKIKFLKGAKVEGGTKTSLSFYPSDYWLDNDKYKGKNDYIEGDEI